MFHFNLQTGRDSALSFVGSDLKIDGIHFKSQTQATGMKNYQSGNTAVIYPNPSKGGVFFISNIKSYDLISVYNIYGQEVNEFIVKNPDAVQIQINASGAYFIKINSSGKITTQKIIVTQD